jgi:hypothetical protein
MSSGRRHGLALVALFASLAGCATSSAATGSGADASAGVAAPASADPASENTIRIEVRHDKLNAGSVTIYIEPATGVRTALGTLDPGQTRTYSWETVGGDRRVRLVALGALGTTTVSEALTVPPRAGLIWDLQINALRVQR